MWAFILAIDKVPGVGDSGVSSNWGVMNLIKDLPTLFGVVFKVGFSSEKVIWQKCDTFIEIYSPLKVFSSTKKVSNGVTFAWEVFKFEIVILKKLVPSGLSGHNVLRLLEVFKVLMVCSDEELLLSAQKKRSEIFYGIDNG